MYTHIRSIPSIVSAIAICVISLSSIQVSFAQGNHLEANKATARKLFAAFADPAQFAEVDSLIASDFVVHFSTGDLGWDAMKVGAESVASAMPDITYKPLIMLAEGNYVGLRYEFAGTFTKPMTDLATGNVVQPTGKPVALTSNVILTFSDDGKIKGYEEVFDNLSYAAQIGLFAMPDAAMPPPAKPVDSSVWTIANMSSAFTANLKKSLEAANMSAYNKGEVEALDAMYAPNYISYPTMADLARNKLQIANIRTAIPDFTVTTEAVLAEGNWVVYHWKATGTFTAPAQFSGMTLKPTNKPVSYDGIVLAYANENGQIVADWSEMDNLSIGMQLGMIPTQAQ